MVTFTAVAHVALVVRLLEPSVRWYESVLGFERVGEVRAGPPEAGHPRQLVRHPGSGLVLGLHEPLERSDDPFDPSRTGLDHVALAVPDLEALEAWRARLVEAGVEVSPVRDLGYASFVSFADPSGIAWELWVPPPEPDPGA